MRIALAAPLLLSACLAMPPERPPSPAPMFSPLAFFDGHTEGEGSLKIVARRRQAVHVDGHGRLDPDGALTLEQTIDRPGKPAKPRVWHLQRVAPGHYKGTLSDARGAVTGETNGSRLHLAFRTKGGLAVQQFLTLAVDGRSARNIMVVRKMGVMVAVLDETIRKR